MKQILKTIQKQIQKVEKIIEKREGIYDKRTERWKQSESGMVYESDTLELDSILDFLQSAMGSLQEITGNYN